MNAILKNLLTRKTPILGLFAACCLSLYADVMDQLELGSEFGEEVRSIREYDPTNSKYSGTEDEHNPFKPSIKQRTCRFIFATT